MILTLSTKILNDFEKYPKKIKFSEFSTGTKTSKNDSFLNEF